MKNNGLIEKVVHFAAIMAGIALLFMTSIICYEVIMRYLLNRPTIWETELSEFLMVVCAFLGMGYTELQNKHTRVDIVLYKMPSYVQGQFFRANCIITIFICGILTWKSTERAINYFHYTSSSEWAPPLFPVYISIAIGYFLYIMASLFRLLKFRQDQEIKRVLY